MLTSAGAHGAPAQRSVTIARKYTRFGQHHSTAPKPSAQ
jgi:hypothetical protein